MFQESYVNEACCPQLSILRVGLYYEFILSILLNWLLQLWIVLMESLQRKKKRRRLEKWYSILIHDSLYGRREASEAINKLTKKYLSENSHGITNLKSHLLHPRWNFYFWYFWRISIVSSNISVMNSIWKNTPSQTLFFSYQWLLHDQ